MRFFLPAQTTRVNFYVDDVFSYGVHAGCLTKWTTWTTYYKRIRCVYIIYEVVCDTSCLSSFKIISKYDGNNIFIDELK